MYCPSSMSWVCMHLKFLRMVLSNEDVAGIPFKMGYGGSWVKLGRMGRREGSREKRRGE